MTGIGTVLIIWGIVLVAVGATLLTIGILFYRKGKLYHDTRKKLLIEAEQRVKLKYNRIATLEPNELITYLGGIFSRFLELNSEVVSNRDNTATERLFADTLAETLKYLGDDNIAAIEYYYGSGFIEKWASLSYRILEKRRQLGNVVNGTTRYSEIERFLATGSLADLFGNMVEQQKQ